jgi:hypothetical protein
MSALPEAEIRCCFGPGSERDASRRLRPYRLRFRDRDGEPLSELTRDLSGEAQALLVGKRGLAALGGGRLFVYDVNGFLATATLVSPGSARARHSSLAA